MVRRPEDYRHKFAYPSRRYRQYVEWIAMNDDVVTMDLEVIAGYLTVTMLAHVNNLDRDRVAHDVLFVRHYVNTKLGGN